MLNLCILYRKAVHVNKLDLIDFMTYYPILDSSSLIDG